MLDRMALIKGLPVIIGLTMVIVSFIAQFVPFLSFLVVGQDIFWNRLNSSS